MGDKILASAVGNLEKSEISEAMHYCHDTYQMLFIADTAHKVEAVYEIFNQYLKKAEVIPDVIIFHIGDDYLDGELKLHHVKMILKAVFGQIRDDIKVRSMNLFNSFQCNTRFVWSTIMQRKVYMSLRNYEAGPNFRRKLVQMGTKFALAEGFSVVSHNTITPRNKQFFQKFTGILTDLALYQLLCDIDKHMFGIDHGNSKAKYKPKEFEDQQRYSCFRPEMRKWEVAKFSSSEKERRKGQPLGRGGSPADWLKERTELPPGEKLLDMSLLLNKRELFRGNAF